MRNFLLGVMSLALSLAVGTACAAVANAQNNPAGVNSTSPSTTQTNTAANHVIQQNFIQNAAIAGVTFNQTNNNLDITINEQTAIAAIPAMEAQKAIPSVATADIKRLPLGLAVAVVGVSFTVIIIDATYTMKPDVDKLHVQAFVLPTGGHEKQLCYAFDFDRTLYTKMDLNTLTPKTFMLNTPGFTFSDWCKANMESEAKK